MSDPQPTPPRPGRSVEDDTSSASSPVTACRRCRKQKLRCSRDLPTCKRCRDISSPCEYPPPPDRKLLAAQRLQNAKVRARRESEASALQEQRLLSDHANHSARKEKEASVVPQDVFKRSDSVGESDHGQSVPDDYQIELPPLQTALRTTNMPSPEVAMFLIEIYFARMYNAHLLFHKESFVSDFANGKVADFIALAIFASASVFLRQPPEKSRSSGGSGDEMEFGLSMLSAADWTRQGDEWANAAGQRALMQADIPRIEIAQTCQCLGLYWWAIGERERTHIMSHNAYMNVRLLGLQIPSEDNDAFSDEVRRRLFWACWMNQCIGQENASFKEEPWKDAIGLKLPSDEESWHARRPEAKEQFDSKGNIVNCDGSDISPTPSENSETIKLLGIWWEVQRYLTLHHHDTPDDAVAKFAGLLELDRRLGQVFENLHPNLQYLSVITFKSPKVDKYRLFALHILYRATNCALHSSVVPLFSNTATNPHASKKAIRLSAEESVKHAAIILDMATAFMSTRPDISRLPSMVGFAMFVATTIQFKSLGAQRKLQTYGTGRFKAAVFILDRLKLYWDSLNGLWDNLKSMFAPSGIEIDAMPLDPRFQNSSEDQNTDLEKIVSHEGVPHSGDAAALYTYVAIQEGKAGASPRRNSDGHSSQTRRTKSAQNTPSPGSMAFHAENPEQSLPILQKQESGMNANVPPFLSQRQYSSSQSSAQPRTQPFEHQSFNSSGYRRPSVNALGTRDFAALGTVPEDYQAQAPTSNVLYGGMPMDAYGGPGIATAMDVDGLNVWWDQSYGSLDMEVVDPNADINPRDGYQFQNFSFGY